MNDRERRNAEKCENDRYRRNVGVEMCKNDRRNDAKMSGCENLFGWENEQSVEGYDKRGPRFFVLSSSLALTPPSPTSKYCLNDPFLTLFLCLLSFCLATSR